MCGPGDAGPLTGRHCRVDAPGPPSGAPSRTGRGATTPSPASHCPPEVVSASALIVWDLGRGLRRGSRPRPHRPVPGARSPPCAGARLREARGRGPALTPAAAGPAQELLLLRVPDEFLPAALLLGFSAGHGGGSARGLRRRAGCGSPGARRAAAAARGRGGTAGRAAPSPHLPGARPSPLSGPHAPLLPLGASGAPRTRSCHSRCRSGRELCPGLRRAPRRQAAAGQSRGTVGRRAGTEHARLPLARNWGGRAPGLYYIAPRGRPEPRPLAARKTNRQRRAGPRARGGGHGAGTKDGGGGRAEGAAEAEEGCVRPRAGGAQDGGAGRGAEDARGGGRRASVRRAVPCARARLAWWGALHLVGRPAGAREPRPAVGSPSLPACSGPRAASLAAVRPPRLAGEGHAGTRQLAALPGPALPRAPAPAAPRRSPPLRPRFRPLPLLAARLPPARLRPCGRPEPPQAGQMPAPLRTRAGRAGRCGRPARRCAWRLKPV